MMTLMRKVGEDYLKSKMVKGGGGRGKERKNPTLPEHTQHVSSNFIMKKKIVLFEWEGHFSAVVIETLKILVRMGMPKFG